MELDIQYLAVKKCQIALWLSGCGFCSFFFLGNGYKRLISEGKICRYAKHAANTNARHTHTPHPTAATALHMMKGKKFLILNFQDGEHSPQSQKTTRIQTHTRNQIARDLLKLQSACMLLAMSCSSSVMGGNSKVYVLIFTILATFSFIFAAKFMTIIKPVQLKHTSKRFH